MHTIGFEKYKAIVLKIELVIVCFLVGFTSVGFAQEDGSQISVKLITVGPGHFVWERFGHNALWISDGRDGTERAYNYGLFSFEQEDFLPRFLQGRMLYWMRGFETDNHLQGYIRSNRSVWVQDLNLTPAQRLELVDFLKWNERPENRFYRCHYYRDNCSTRLRDALDDVLGGIIHDQTANSQTGATFRFHSLRLVRDDFWTYTGLLLGLGQPTDRPISAWDEMFLPLRLRDHLRFVQTVDTAGNTIPLVSAERTMFESTEHVEHALPPRWLFAFLAAGLVVGVLLSWLAFRAINHRGFRIFYSIGVGLWCFLIGVGGLVLASLWLFTDHDTSYRNENLFFFDPIAIFLVVLGPLLIYRIRWAVRPGRLVAAFVAGFSLLGLILQVVPGIDQINGQVIAFTLPPNLALSTGLLWFSSIVDAPSEN